MKKLDYNDKLTEVLHCSVGHPLLCQATSDKKLSRRQVPLGPETMVVPLGMESSQVSVDSWKIHIMQCPKMHFVVHINETFGFQECDQAVVDIRQTTPEVPPQSFDALIMEAPPSEGTAPSRTSKNVHEHPDICVLSSTVCSHS